MGVFQADLSIKTSIELGLEDIRENTWLLEDILSDCLTNPYLRDKYGKKQVEACIEWFANNKVDIYMNNSGDRDRLPCITISLGSSAEKSDMKTMADQSTETVVLLPNKINKPIPYIIKPFVPDSYDELTGLVGIDSSINIDSVSAGMILVNPSNGEGFPILDIDPNGIHIEAGINIEDGSKFGIVPKYQYYEARVEHTFFQETYQIGCHVHGDPQALLWLHSIVLYSILRYREGLLEANGFAESVVSSSDMVPNADFTTEGGEKAWSRYITLTGQVENSWIKSPRRIIESVVLKEKTSTGFTGGIKILTNLDSPPFIDPETETWTTEEDRN